MLVGDQDNDVVSKFFCCNENDMYDASFVEKKLQSFCDAYHKSLCYDDNGKMVRCVKCGGLDFSPVDLVDITLLKKMVQFGMQPQPCHPQVRCH
jgi:hypothetical protein